ncbi:MAG: glycosyltransferase family 1 protein, partial [Ardenticatenales bacterium]
MSPVGGDERRGVAAPQAIDPTSAVDAGRAVASAPNIGAPTSPTPLRVILSGWFAHQTFGSGQYVDQLAEALRALPAPPIVDIPTPTARGSLAKARFEQWTVPAIARRTRADVLHVPYWAPPLLQPIPTVVTVHDLIPLLLPAYRTDWRVRVYSRLVAIATRRAAAVIADSDHTARDVARHLRIAPERIHTVLLGVAPRFTPQTADAITRVRATHALPPAFGLYYGGFDPRKDLPTLISAWRSVWDAHHLPLVIAGRPPSREHGSVRGGHRISADSPCLPPHRDTAPFFADVTALARAAGLPEPALRPIGHVADDDLPALLSAATLFAYPSTYEGFGLPPLEAMACGTPVAVADATSLPEVVGDAGLRIAPGDVAAWVGALSALAGDAGLRERMGGAGRGRAAGFTWGGVAERTVGVYR